MTQGPLSRREIDEMVRDWDPETRDKFYEMEQRAKENEGVGGQSPVALLQAQYDFHQELLSLEDGTLLQLDDYEDRTAHSTELGTYPRTKPVLDVSAVESSDLSDDEFHAVVDSGMASLSQEEDGTAWSAYVVPYRHESGSPIVRILSFGLTKEKALDLMDADLGEFPPGITTSEDLQRSALEDVARRLAEILGEAGYPASYPRRLTEEEMTNPDALEDPLEGKEVSVELRYAGKDIVQYGYEAYIEEEAESPIESRLAMALVLHGMPPVLQVEVPDPEYDDKLCQPDIVVPGHAQPLLIFADGAGAHGGKDAQTHDRRVNRRLDELEFEVFRVSGSDIHSNIERVVEDVKGRMYGRAARILPEEFWLPKITQALEKASAPSDIEFLEDLREWIEEGRRVTVKQERYLNKICGRLGVERTYDWIDEIFPDSAFEF